MHDIAAQWQYLNKQPCAHMSSCGTLQPAHLPVYIRPCSRGLSNPGRCSVQPIVYFGQLLENTPSSGQAMQRLATGMEQSGRPICSAAALQHSTCQLQPVAQQACRPKPQQGVKHHSKACKLPTGSNKTCHDIAMSCRGHAAVQRGFTVAHAVVGDSSSKQTLS